MDEKTNVATHICNGVLHVIGGIFLCYLFIPKAPLYTLLLLNGAFGSIREYIQILRNHPQENWKQYTDTAEWMLGAIIYYVLRENNMMLNPDKVNYV